MIKGAIQADNFYQKMGSQLSKQHLSKLDLISIYDLAHFSLSVATEKDFEALLQRIKELVPVEAIVSGIAKTDKNGGFQEISRINNISYPSDWMAIYVQNNYAAIDPVMKRHFGSYSPQMWSQTYALAANDAELEFIDRSRQFGLEDGFTLGEQDKLTDRGSLFSFSGKEVTASNRHLTVLSELTPFLHSSYLKLPAPSLKQPIAATFTAREIEVLQWVAVGKTNWEISMILNISEPTVKFHLKNSMVKLGVSSRSYAAAAALSLGLIEL